MESKQKEEMKGPEMEYYCPICKSKESPPLERCCFFCKETETPLWRSGPLGPKSLCNACGIRYSKKRPRSARGDGGSGGGEKEKERRRIVKEKLEGENWSAKEWGEIERAALLLMGLSCGGIFT